MNNLCDSQIFDCTTRPPRDDIIKSPDFKNNSYYNRGNTYAFMQIVQCSTAGPLYVIISRRRDVVGWCCVGFAYIFRFLIVLFRHTSAAVPRRPEITFNQIICNTHRVVGTCISPMGIFSLKRYSGPSLYPSNSTESWLFISSTRLCFKATTTYIIIIL